MTINKIGASVVGLGLALALILGAAAPVAAQAMSLSQLVDLFISLGIISPDKAAAAKAAVSSSASVSYTRDLTVGSTGADVTSLQTMLGVSPATGYFGSITKAAVQSYQASKGVPATGYVGPLTRAELNKGSSTVVTTPGTGTVVNTGVEGTLTVNKAAVSNTTAYEGDSMRAILALKAEAKVSDIAIQRVKLDLGTTTSIYTKVYKTMYLVDDAGAVLAQADLNSNTVVKDSSRYYLTLGGFSYIVPKNSSKVLTIKADIYNSIDSSDRGNRTITLANDGVRGVDGAGIDQYSPATGSNVSQVVSINSSLVDSASATLTINSSNFKTTEVIAADGSENNEYDRLPLVAFDIKASKDNLLVTDIAIAITKALGGAATTSTVYLMDGSNVIASDSVETDGTASFDDIDVSVAKDATKTFTVRADIRQANGTSASFAIASVTPTIENSVGDTITASGSAAGETMYVRNVGPQFTLVSKTINKSQSAEVANSSTTTVKATFDLKIAALGDAIQFGGQSASGTFQFKIYKDGTALAGQSTVSSSTSFTTPNTGVIAHGVGGFVLQEENEVTIPVETVFIGNNLGLGSYAIGLEAIAWNASGAATTSFMAGNIDWRTSTVQLP